MRVIKTDPGQIETTLKQMGVSESSKALFMNNQAPKCYRLSGIKNEYCSLLKETFNSSGVEIIFGEGEHTRSALLIGSLQNLKNASEYLKKTKGVTKVLGDKLDLLSDNGKFTKTDILQLGSKTLHLGERTLIMGILNVTPDSFSDGGRFDQVDKALEHAHQMAADGADIIDIGGESTRPGHTRISVEEELDRIMPVIEELKKDQSFDVPLSIDTYKPEVAKKALTAGVEMLNDVWGMKENKELGKVAATYQVPVCLMHNRSSTDYEDLIPDIITELEESIELAHQAGIDDTRIIIDPGIGFGKTYDQNLEVMRSLKDICNLGYPVLLGTSRKSIIAKTLNLPAEERVEGTAATQSLGIAAGADIIRIHDVKEMKRVATMTDAIVRR